MLFSTKERTDASPAAYSESQFQYLDRAARLEAERVRVLLEEWHAQYPPQHQDAMQRRIQSGSNDQFFSATSELYVHRLLSATSHHITVEPQLPEVSTRPDFHAAFGESQFLFEVAVATELGGAKRASDAHLHDLYDALNKIHSPDFFLTLDNDGEPLSPIPSRRWAQRIRQWLDTLDYDDIIGLGPDLQRLPSLTLGHNGLTITFRPIAKKRSARGSPGRLIGAHSGEAVWVTSWRAIKKAVRGKASRYGSLAIPYTIVINALGAHCDAEEFESALFGNQGLWANDSSPTHTRVSAVLGFIYLAPQTFASAVGCMYHNPFATMPYEGPLLQLPQTKLVGRKLQRLGGIHPRELIGLPEHWPFSAA